MKRRIRLSESTLHRIIKESVRRILREGKFANNKPYFPGKGRGDWVYGNSGEFSQSEIDKHNSRIPNAHDADKLSRRENEIIDSNETGRPRHLYLDTLQGKLHTRNLEDYDDQYWDEGGEGFEYLSNPSSLPPGWQ